MLTGAEADEIRVGSGYCKSAGALLETQRSARAILTWDRREVGVTLAGVVEMLVVVLAVSPVAKSKSDWLDQLQSARTSFT
jgi:hypothetical protein